MIKNLFKKAPKSIKDIAIEHLSEAVEEYDSWYSEHGLKLPPDYASDPSGWTEDLHKMAKAFRLLRDKNRAITNETEEEIRSGLFLFGKYLYWLDDEIK